MTAHAQTPSLLPVADPQRVHAVDTLRGVAVLGILAMNITSFALPMDAYMNPMLPGLEKYIGNFEGLPKWLWVVVHLIFDTKMMTIFSMLFGAGLVLQSGRFESDAGRGSFASVYYRRLLWLFLIGMAHAYLVWYGDILVAYALCGLLLYPMRRMRPFWLIAIGVFLMLVGMTISTAFGGMLSWMRTMHHDAQVAMDDGAVLTDLQREMHKAWLQASEGMTPTPEKLAKTVSDHRAGWLTNLAANAPAAALMQTFLFLMMMLWRGLGCMLVGMGLMKLGVFSASRSKQFYLKLLAIGYGVGLPIVAIGAWNLLRIEFDMVSIYFYAWHFNYVGGFLVCLGHVALVMLIVQSGSLTWLTSRLRAVGRMALTNYLSQSILCTIIFWGWGLGMFAKLTSPQFYAIVVGIWILQLLWSPWWMNRFRFGPAEWLWRSLTYLTRQPFRRETPGTLPAPS